MDKRKWVVLSIIAGIVIVALTVVAFAFIPKTNSSPTPTNGKPSTHKPTQSPTPTPTPSPTPIQAYPVSLLESGVKVGAFVPPSPNKNDGMSSVDALEDELGARMDTVNWFVKWADQYDQFTTSNDHTTAQLQLQEASADGRTPMVTWEPWAKGDSTTSVGSFSMANIASGQYDDYIHSWAQGMATFGQPVYIRFAHEMNGNWYPWSAGSSPQSDYIAGWKHVVDIFRADGATNVKWIWAPAQKDFSGTLESYYPGNDYVDVMGTSLYNCHSDGWLSFHDLLQPVYDRLTALNTDKPVWITELGTCDPTETTVANWNNQPRADWYADIFNNSTFGRLQMMVLFDAVGNDAWQIPAGSDSANAFQNAYSQSKGWATAPQGAHYGSALGQVSNLKDTNTDPTINALSWDVLDNAQGYVIKRDGVIVATTLGTTWTEYNINSSTDRTYSVAPINNGTVGASAQLTMK